ncbi:hypothetical protein NC651_004561 [Populus alba x Populus x berolinensis]|nr:hypothetical protein NC651_004561 [Populus alba x Populus x berolinensis]
MEKSSFKLTFLVVVLLIIASCLDVGEARGPVITFRCQRDSDCVGEKCWCDKCYCQSSKRCACKFQSSLSDAIIGAQSGKPEH